MKVSTVNLITVNINVYVIYFGKRKKLSQS